MKGPRPSLLLTDRNLPDAKGPDSPLVRRFTPPRAADLARESTEYRRLMPGYTWPPEWQAEAVAATEPYVNTEYLIDVLVGPTTSISGTALAGYLYSTAAGELQMIYDHSERPDVYPWPLLRGPVLRVSVRLPKKRRTVVYAHPDWTPKRDRDR